MESGILKVFVSKKNLQEYREDKIAIGESERIIKPEENDSTVWELFISEEEVVDFEPFNDSNVITFKKGGG